MGFENIKELGFLYKIPEQDFVHEFLIPVLLEAKNYKRSAGFFSSSSLKDLAAGLINITKDGHIQLITSPKLSVQDIQAINNGYEMREELVQSIVSKSLNDTIVAEDKADEECYNLLAHLIAGGVLDIKIGFSYKDGYLGLYHDKSGIFEDENGNKIAFIGSGNETDNAMYYNFEQFVIFESRKEGDKAKIAEIEKAFDDSWNDINEGAKIFSFPEAAKNKLLSFRKDTIDFDSIRKKYNRIFEKEKMAPIEKEYNIPYLPDDRKLRDYQLDAIKKWKEKGYRGIFDMATGTGKTYTALGAITQLTDDILKHDKCVILIVCPYQHLVEQWVEDLKAFNIDPIVGYSAVNYKERLKNEIEYINYDVRRFMCFITTNATFRLKDTQKMLQNIETDNILLCVDEAHNFGSVGLQNTLNERYKYRLALSATLERHGDFEGTQKLLNYFGEKCIEYTLKEAIQNGVLTKYYYYPICVTLNDEEKEKYEEYTEKISNLMNVNNEDAEKALEILLVQRARIVAGADDKYWKLKEEMTKHVGEKNMLIYCGATKNPNVIVSDSEYGVSEDVKQLERVLKMLDKEMNIRATKFTAEEDIEQRKRIVEYFKNGEIDAIVAIKCLDEGVNIPSIEKAFILASSTNPKEYIQRRGRVLRQSKDTGKKFAYIYDFITLPYDLKYANKLNESENSIYKTMVKNELVRMKDFADLAENSFDCTELINDIKDTFNINLKEDE